MSKATTELLFDPFGRKVFMTLLKPRAGRWFEQDIREMLSETDEITAVTSKKDAAIRRKELLQYLLPHLVSKYRPLCSSLNYCASFSSLKRQLSSKSWLNNWQRLLLSRSMRQRISLHPVPSMRSFCPLKSKQLNMSLWTERQISFSKSF